ncbi:MAG: zeta toxin family protein [Planctomycetes bacterium]|nr:zeta toxin family protein [Planctomycetota bacterium]
MKSRKRQLDTSRNASDRPCIIVIAGPNGAGKSTTAPALLRGTLGVTEFVNADTIAHGLSAYAPESAAQDAGRIMLDRIRKLAKQRTDFAFETTLASRTYAPWIRQIKNAGYLFHLVFLWLPTADAAVGRVAARVQAGGHSVPEATIRRRFDRGLRNFFKLYRPLANTWRFYNNMSTNGPRLLARGHARLSIQVKDHKIWDAIENSYGQEV